MKQIHYLFKNNSYGRRHKSFEVDTVNSRYRKRLPYSKVCFKVVTMCLLGVGTVARLKSLATNQYARENGIVSSATSENTSVRIVPTDSSPL